jgi:hypothetical protein
MTNVERNYLVGYRVDLIKHLLILSVLTGEDREKDADHKYMKNICNSVIMGIQ